MGSDNGNITLCEIVWLVLFRQDAVFRSCNSHESLRNEVLQGCGIKLLPGEQSLPTTTHNSFHKPHNRSPRVHSEILQYAANLTPCYTNATAAQLKRDRPFAIGVTLSTVYTLYPYGPSGPP